MSYNYTLRYRTYEQMLNEVFVDFQNYNLQAYIEPHQLIKVVKRVNYDLGLRINQTIEAVLEVEKGRVRLPDNFYVLNFALICGDYTVQEAMPQGTHVEERIISPTYKCQPSTIDTCTDPVFPSQTCNSCGTCSTSPCSCMQKDGGVPSFAQQCMPCPRVQLNCKGEQYELVQIINSQTRSYKFLMPLKMLANPQNIDCDCPNLYWTAQNTGWIKDNFLYTNFQEGKVYINYQGMMEDDNGNLLVPDHDLLNDYYEYAVKQRILENLIMNDQPVGQKMQIIEARYRESRNKALSLVNTPNFAELKKVFESNRKAMYGKYYDMFKSYPWNQRWVNNPLSISPISNYAP
jgi:hypothetical protein